jgi:hypothetical protein
VELNEWSPLFYFLVIITLTLPPGALPKKVIVESELGEDLQK